MQARGSVERLARLPLALELGPRLREPRREGVRDVVVSGDRDDGRAEALEEARRVLVLLAPPAVREVAARDHELRADVLDERCDRAFDCRIVALPEVQIRDVEHACRHGRGGYTLAAVTEEIADSAEIFDDLYLGLRAGGALRKQRRGEPLTAEEREAIGRWQRLSPWRKGVAIGAFAFGTFGLGFTLGALICGRWRKA